MELFISILKNSSAKGSFRSSKINYEILQLSADSRYLQSGKIIRPNVITLKSLLHLGHKVITLRTLLHLGSFITFRPSTISLAIHCFVTGAKMATRFETFLEDEISAIIEVVAQTNTKKAKNFGLSVFTGR